MQSVQKVYENQMRTEFVSKEDPEQVKAFEYYCTLGRKRSYKKVADLTGSDVFKYEIQRSIESLKKKEKSEIWTIRRS